MLKTHSGSTISLQDDSTEPQIADSGTRRGQREDRRKNHARAFFHSISGKGRRKGSRRDDDHKAGQVVDYHEPALFYLTIAILLLCVADAAFTLTILGLGGEEVNPFMKALLEEDVTLFFIVKFLLTSIFLIFTVIHKRFRLLNRISGYQIIYSVFALYVLLVVYEIFLITTA